MKICQYSALPHFQGILLDRTAVSRIESQSRYVMDYEAAVIARALKVSGCVVVCGTGLKPT
jgi:hypothetical protein